MKKSLFALAAVTAFAGAAQAQSSVTVYGILDMGYAGGTSTVNNSASTPVNAKTNYSGFTSSGEQSSRLGFKGSEDLGGGAQAIFTAEFQLYPSDQSLSGNANAGLFNRQSFIGLHKNGLGQATAGTQYTPVFNAFAATDAGGVNNIVGDAIHPYSTLASANQAGANSIGMSDRVSNSLMAQSDKFSGFSVGGMLTDNSKTAPQTSATAGGQTSATGWGLNADYTWNKLYVTGAYQALKQVTTATNGSAAASIIWTSPQAAGATAVPVSGNGTAITTNAVNVIDNQGFVGATYDFGILKAYAQYITRTATSTANSADYVKRQAEQIGVRSFITPTIEAWGQAGLGRYTAGTTVTPTGSGVPTANFLAWQLGSNYWLSKRTNLYAIYGYTSTSNAAVGTTTISGNTNNYAVGMRHTF